MISTMRRVGLAAAVVTAGLIGAPTASAQTAPVIEGGKTKPVFSYTDAIRERVFIPNRRSTRTTTASRTRIAIDIIRPARPADAGLKVPAIIDPSPYYTTVGRGNETQCKADYDGDGVLDRGRCSTTTTSSRAATP